MLSLCDQYWTVTNIDKTLFLELITLTYIDISTIVGHY